MQTRGIEGAEREGEREYQGNGEIERGVREGGKGYGGRERQTDRQIERG